MLKRIMMVGNISSGKTTLCQFLSGQDLNCPKTQTIQIVGNSIDTPGEYMQHRYLTRALIVTSVDAEVILFLQDCTDVECQFSPGHASMFPIPVIGVVTKIDIAKDKEQIENAVQLLKHAGAAKVFCISCFNGMGTSELVEFLQDKSIRI